MDPAREWKCDVCGAVTIQTGPHALEFLPTPPVDWAVVDTTRILPPRTVGEGQNKVKAGWARDVVRKVLCGNCSK